MRAMSGEKGIVECAYVASDVIPELAFFASKCELGENGLEKVLGCGEMDSFEKVQVSNATAKLKASIEKGVEFANAPAAEK